MPAISRDSVASLEVARSHLLKRGVSFASGLTIDEMADIERQWKFNFPPDMAWFLSTGFPVGNKFPDWRGAKEQLAKQFAWPCDGICFDVRQAGYWRSEWGSQPRDTDEAVQIAIQHIQNMPILIPLFGHSYLPSAPCVEGNPVFSVHQTDVIHRGANLAMYYMWLFHDDSVDESTYPVFDPKYRSVKFWSDLAFENSQ